VGDIALMPISAKTTIDKRYKAIVPREVKILQELKEGNEIGRVFNNGRVMLRKKTLNR